MDNKTITILEHHRSSDKELRYRAFLAIMKVTEDPVEWAYQHWGKIEIISHYGIV